MVTIAEIEDAILAALKASDLAGVCKTIDTYHGELDDLVKEINRLTIPFPAVLVLYGGSAFSEPANRSYDEEPVFTVLHIAKDLRGRSALRDGIYEMLEITRETLIDKNLGLDIEPLHPVSIAAVMVTGLLSIYSFDIKSNWSRD